MARTEISVRKTRWKGRPGYRLTNGEVQITALTGGGSIAELRSKCGPEQWSPNLLWEAPWTTMDPGGFQPRHERQYGTPFVGKFLAPFTGHVVCLDYFGAPSQEEKACGLTLHGEACVARWKVTPSPGGVTMQARLPFAGLDLRREVRLLKGESAIYVSETVINRKPVDHLLHWVQHVTLGPPFLASSECSIAAPGKQGKTWPHGYEGKSLLADDHGFRWPMAPKEGGGSVDLSRPFSEEGKGFVAAILFDTAREWAFVAVLNYRLCLLLGFCFPRAMYPWLTFWEENRARSGPPWNGRTAARGFEFGTTPFPVGREAAFSMGSLFGVSVFRRVGAKASLRANYAVFAVPVSPGWRKIADVQVESKEFVVTAGHGERVSIAARAMARIGKA